MDKAKSLAFLITLLASAHVGRHAEASCPPTTQADCSSIAYAESFCGRTAMQQNTGPNANPTWICETNCPATTPADCQDPDYFKTICGMLEASANVDNEQWPCHSDWKQRNDSLHDEYNSFPEDYLEPSQSLPYGHPIKDDQDPLFEAYELEFLDASFSVRPTTTLTDTYDDPVDPLRFSSCKEYSYEKTWTFSKWIEDYSNIDLHGPDAAIEHYFQNISLGVSALNRSGFRDSEGTLIPDTKLDRVLDYPLNYWDSVFEDIDEDAPHFANITFGFLHQLYDLKNSNGWETEDLEAIGLKMGEFERLLGELALIELQMMHEYIIYKAKQTSSTPLTICRNAAATLGNDRFASLLATRLTMATRFAPDGFSRTVTGNLGFRYDFVTPPNGVWWNEDPVGPDEYIPGTPDDAELTRFCGLGDDPEAGLTFDPPEDLINPGLDGFGLGYTDLFNDFLNQIVEVNYPGFRTNPVPSTRIEELLKKATGKQQDMILELQSLFALLNPICSPDPRYCMLSYSELYAQLSAHISTYRKKLEQDCLKLTGNDLGQSELYQRNFTRPEIPADATDPSKANCNHESSDFDIDYSANISEFDKLKTNIHLYQLARTCWLDWNSDQVVDQTLRDVEQSDGQVRLGKSYSEEFTKGGTLMQAGVRHELLSEILPLLNADGTNYFSDPLDAFCSLQAAFERIDKVVGSNENSSETIVESTVVVGYEYQGGVPFEPFRVAYYDFDAAAGHHFFLEANTEAIEMRESMDLHARLIVGLKTPYLFNLIGIPFGFDLRFIARARAGADLSAHIEFPQVCSASQSRLAAQAEFAADVDIVGELYLINIIIVETGVRGHIDVVTIDVGLDAGVEIELASLADMSDAFLLYYGCSLVNPVPASCTNGDPGDLLRFKAWLDVGSKGESGGGRIQVFARLNFIVFKVEGAITVARWPGSQFEVIPEVDEDFEFVLNQEFFCKDELFGRISSACP